MTGGYVIFIWQYDRRLCDIYSISMTGGYVIFIVSVWQYDRWLCDIYGISMTVWQAVGAKVVGSIPGVTEILFCHNYFQNNIWYEDDSFYMNNYIVRSYRDVIVVTNTATRKMSKAYSIFMY